eukprot:TRINITY_DN4641_c0_g1_i2.p1 TRINITY_DN4641_c0_g1~~TRINITY_DN4641_c0_g1_i2.p1  ORF type:complete len:814 (-),score=239.27 TRINITY_DN4641_c0_g1_i2:1803-4244(-)
MDVRVRKQLGLLVAQAVKTPATASLDVSILPKIKQICKQSNENVKSVYQLLFEQLKQPHSLKRYWSLLIIEELFARSKYFRSLLVKDFRLFIDLTVGPRPDTPLPSPAMSAEMLRKKALELIEKWHEAHGQYYLELRTGYSYLEQTKKMTFPRIRARAERQEQERQEREQKTQALLKVKFGKAKTEISEFGLDIENNLQEMQACFDIIIPPSLQQQFQQQQQQQALTTTTTTTTTTPPALQTAINGDETQESSSSTTKESKGEAGAEDEEEGDWRWAFPDGCPEDEEEEKREPVIGNGNQNGSEDRSISPTAERLDMRREGLGSFGYAIQVSFDKQLDLEDREDQQPHHQQKHQLQNTTAFASADVANLNVNAESNKALFDTLRNGLKLIVNRHAGLVRDWMDTLQRLDIPLPTPPPPLPATTTTTTTTTPTTHEYELQHQQQEQQELFIKQREERRIRDQLFRRVIDMKANIDAVRRKCAQLNIEITTHTHSKPHHAPNSEAHTDEGDSERRSDGEYENGEEEEEDEFEEVKMKDDYEHEVVDDDAQLFADLAKEDARIAALASQTGTTKKKRQADAETESSSGDDSKSPTKKQKLGTDDAHSTDSHSNPNTPTRPKPQVYVPYWQRGLRLEDIKPAEIPENETREDLLARAPIMENVGGFLDYWGEKDMPLNNSGMEFVHRFLGSAEEKTVPVGALGMRVDWYSPPPLISTKTCRAPMPNGTLCTRMDLKKCPFHGKIIPRNELGEPSTAQQPEPPSNHTTTSPDNKKRSATETETRRKRLQRLVSTPKKKKVKEYKPRVSSTTTAYRRAQ